MKKLLIAGSLAVVFVAGTAFNHDVTALTNSPYLKKVTTYVFKDSETGCQYITKDGRTFVPRYETHVTDNGNVVNLIKGCEV